MTDKSSGKLNEARNIVYGQDGDRGPFYVLQVDDQGRLQVVDTSDVTPPMEGQAPDGVTVTAVSGEVLAANPDRVAAVLVNDSDTEMYLAIGHAAVANQGIRLNAAGGSLVISKYGPLYSTEAVNAILAAAGNKEIAVQEFE